MGPPGGMRGTDQQFPLHRTQIGGKEVQEQSVDPRESLADMVMHQRAENDRAIARFANGRVDTPQDLICLVNTVDKWHSHLIEFVFFKLRQQTAAQCFCGHPGLVRQKKYDASIDAFLVHDELTSLAVVGR